MIVAQKHDWFALFPRYQISSQTRISTAREEKYSSSRMNGFDHPTLQACIQQRDKAMVNAFHETLQAKVMEQTREIKRRLENASTVS